MKVWIEREVNGRTEYVGKDKHGWWQWTSDAASRTWFADDSAKATTLDLARQMLGPLRIVSDSGEVLDVRLVFTEAKP